MNFKKKLFWSIVAVLIAIVGYYAFQLYKFSEGVVEDANRLENYEKPKEIKLTDSTTMNIKELNQDSLELE